MASQEWLVSDFGRVQKAYFNTTQGILAGHPNDEEVLKVRELLDANDIAYLYNADISRPRPVFTSEGWDNIGLEEIKECISEISGASF